MPPLNRLLDIAFKMVPSLPTWNVKDTGRMRWNNATGKIAYGGTDAWHDLGDDADIPLTFGIEYLIDGGGSEISPGVKGVFQSPIAGTITKCVLLADQDGDLELDIKKTTLTGYIGGLSSIVASAPPTLSSEKKSSDSTLTGWTTTIVAGDVFQVSVTSGATVEQVTLSLTCSRT